MSEGEPECQRQASSYNLPHGVVRFSRKEFKMRLLSALTIVALFALPIIAQAEDKGNGAGSSSSGGHSNQGASAGKVDAASGARSQGSSGDTGKVTPGPKPAAQEDYFLTLDGIKGESQDDKHKDEIH